MVISASLKQGEPGREQVGLVHIAVRAVDLSDRLKSFVAVIFESLKKACLGRAVRPLRGSLVRQIDGRVVATGGTFAFLFWLRHSFCAPLLPFLVETLSCFLEPCSCNFSECFFFSRLIFKFCLKRTQEAQPTL